MANCTLAMVNSKYWNTIYRYNYFYNEHYLNNFKSRFTVRMYVCLLHSGRRNLMNLCHSYSISLSTILRNCRMEFSLLCNIDHSLEFDFLICEDLITIFNSNHNIKSIKSTVSWKKSIISFV